MAPNLSQRLFADYQEHYPYSSSQFSSYYLKKGLGNLTKKISILIEKELFTLSIEQEINRYISNLNNRSYDILSLDILSGGNPIEVKDWVRIQYENGAVGVIFIGDIPAAWADVSGEQFPCDLFYMDIDGVWIDGDSDGIYEDHIPGSGDLGPELYVGRIFISSLQWNSEETMILEYFDTHYCGR